MSIKKTIFNSVIVSMGAGRRYKYSGSPNAIVANNTDTCIVWDDNDQGFLQYYLDPIGRFFGEMLEQ